MSDEISIIGKIDSDMFRAGEARVKQTKIPVDRLRAELEGITDALSKTLTSAVKVGDFELDEVTFQVEISASGKVSLLGTGAEIGTKGAVELKFVRPGAQKENE